MSALLDSLAATQAPRSPAMLAEALRAGLPGPRSEAWKYTSLRALERRGFTSPLADVRVEPALIAHIPAPRFVFVNGHFDAAASDLTSPRHEDTQLATLADALADPDPRSAAFLDRRYAGADAVFAMLNAALAREGMVIRIPPGIDGGIVHLVQVGVPEDGEAAWHLRHFIELGAGAELTLVEHVLHGAPHAHLDNTVLQAHLAGGARLRHLRVQEDAPGATRLLRTDAVLARDAGYRRVDLELGGGLSRHELNVRLEGDGARLLANGVLLGDARRHVDTRLGIEHIAAGTHSLLRWRGLAGGRSRVVFHGGIRIRPGADGSVADLENRNLLLSEDAEIDTQPVLEIDTDEVQAAHGATVGQLDPAALFYLRSRGIDQAQARRMLTAAYCREVLAVIGDERLHGFAEAALQRALDRIGA